MQDMLVTVVALLVGIPAAVSATPQVKLPPPPTCAVPEIVISTLDYPFLLTALPRGTTEGWPVALRPGAPSASVAAVPIITQAHIQPVRFNLTDGRLFTNGFEAELRNAPITKPPQLKGIKFGGNIAGPDVAVSAVYSCDSQGQQYLRLRAERGFAVQKVADGELLTLKPGTFEGTFTDISLKIENPGQ
ncbi:MAG: hypothetical protein M1825_002012 [Sarcosagium campestre]|nr:MAG: hypothetical protein M1825_002012 [Sarcosagium campestre]